MMDISFGWTWPAMKAGRKTCTRRAWKPRHAAMFKKGDIVRATDRARFLGVREHCLIRLTADPVLEPLAAMPDSDYQAEGFEYLREHPELVPDSMPIDVSPEGWYIWRRSGGDMYVVRFEYVEAQGAITEEDS